MNRSYLILLMSLLLTAQSELFAQEVNWRALDENANHLVSAAFGADYSSYYGVSYGYVLRTGRRPLVIGTEFTASFGREILDDWKWRTGIQAELWKSGAFSLALKPAFILRRYESPLARMYSAGTNVSLAFGHVKAAWGLTATAHYDRSFATHLKHGSLKESYPGIRDGWYGASGGNFKFGARAHWSPGSWNVFLHLGKQYGQDFQHNPTLPFFAELSVQKLLHARL
ncbi:MAG: hypothetical protein KF852_18460 [Saprospiraceae bacterium]|nr:hypothetical protein [Saprospiraceae bacterium]